MNTYMSGSLVRTTATFTNISNVNTDPSTITLRYQAGTGPIIILTYAATQITRDATGVYHVDLDTTGFGGPGTQIWTAEWVGTGTVQAIADDVWAVTAPALWPN